MNKLMKCIVGGFLGLLVSYQAYCYAETLITSSYSERIGNKMTGVTSAIYERGGGTKNVKEVILFSNYNFGTTTAVYNDSGGSTSSDGWVDVRDYNDEILISVNLSALNSTGNTLTFQGLLSDDTANIIQIHQTAFTAVNTTYSLPIGSDKGGLKFFRTKGQATGTEGTDTCTILLSAEGRR